MDNDTGRVPDGTRLSSDDQAPAGLGPSGFDPSRFGSWVCAELMSLPESGLVNHAMYDRWVSVTDKAPPLARNDSGWADLAAIAMLCLRHYRDSDRSGEAGETGTGSTEGESAGPQDIAQTTGAA